jgi:hypothetical protein
MGALIVFTILMGFVCRQLYYSHERLYKKALRAWVDHHDIEPKQVSCFHDFYNVKDRDTHEGQCWKCGLQEHHSINGDEFAHYVDGYFAGFGQEW